MPELDFLVVSCPRSGSTWVANWLLTDNIHCVHDASTFCHPEDFDTLRVSGKMFGVVDTGLYLLPSLVNSLDTKVLVIHREASERFNSLQSLGIDIPVYEDSVLDRVVGWHIQYKDLFDVSVAKEVWHYLTGTKFDEHRYKQLTNINCQPHTILETMEESLFERYLKDLQKEKLNDYC